MSATEQELMKLMKQAKKLIEDTEFESCSQWIEREIKRTKKLQEQIDRLQNGANISAKLFNEARDMSNDLHRHCENLQHYKINRVRLGKQVVVNVNPTEAKDYLSKMNGDYNQEYVSPF